MITITEKDKIELFRHAYLNNKKLEDEIQRLKVYETIWNKFKNMLPEIASNFEGNYQLFSANCCEHLYEIMEILEEEHNVKLQDK